MPASLPKPERAQSEGAPRQLTLTGQVVAVAGGSCGIGLAVAEAVRSAGATVAIIARRRPDLGRALKKLGGGIAIAADVTRPGDVGRVFQELGRRCSRLDVLVNRAGVFTFKPFEQTTLREWQQNLDANLTALFLTTRAALPMLTRSQGLIVNVLSISSLKAFARCSAYTAAKFGALGFTRVLAEEVRSRGIRVTAVLPGATNTRLIKAFGFAVDGAALVQPQDVAQAVLSAIRAPSRATFDEIVITPSRGSL